MINFLGIQREIDSVNSQIIFHIAGFPISNTTLAIVLVMVFIVFSYMVFIRKFSLRPNKIQTFIEIVYQGFYNLLFQIVSSKKKTNDLIIIIGSLFVFILFSNLFAIIPIISSITFDGKSMFRAPTSDFSTTLPLALGSLIVIHILSLKNYGLLGYIGKFLKFKEVYLGFKKGISSGFISLIDLFIGLLDIISEFARLLSISIRLFGNIYAAGLVLGTVISGIIAYVLPSVFIGLGLLFSVVQAVVFSSLITIYYILSLPENSLEEIENERA